MHVLIAFDKFKDSMTAFEACRIAREAIEKQRPDWTVETAPLADGGEGFCEILTQAASGELQQHSVLGPQRTPLNAKLGIVPHANIPDNVRKQLKLLPTGKLAIIEMAQASGLEAVPYGERNPWLTSSVGTGELIGIAANAGANAILLGIGGSATNDIGLGALEALGLEFLGAERAPLSELTPKDWEQVVQFRGDIWPHIPPITIACDVENPLVGPRGCTQVFGPQKGLPREELNIFERQLGSLAKKLCRFFDKPETLMAQRGAGAAGGIAFGLQVACDAELTPGFDLIEDWLQLDKKVAQADLIITGEGKFDSSSLDGKGPGTLFAQAQKKGKQVAIFAGQVDLPPNAAQTQHAQGISPSGLPLEQALAAGPENLAQSIEQYLLKK